MPTPPNLSPSPDARERVVVTDVALRDGLQNQPHHVGTAGKAALMRALDAAGVPSIEATSFVSPKAVPQMADATAVMAEALALAPLRASGLGDRFGGVGMGSVRRPQWSTERKERSVPLIRTITYSATKCPHI